MRVAFDDQIFRAQTRGGVSKYVVELMTRLPAHGAQPVRTLNETWNRHLIEAGLAAASGRRPWQQRVEWATWRLAGQPHDPPIATIEADIMHHTFTHGSYLPRWSGPRVVTVHDMTPELLPQHFRLGNPHFAKERYAAESDAIICVSQSTADDMIRLFGSHLEPRTHVIPLGVDDRFFRASLSDDGLLPDEYLLFVGVRSGYKRFDLAVEAARRSMRRHSSLHFVIIGGGPLSRNEQRMLADVGIAERTVHVAPTDQEMPSVYGGASVFLFPSEYEGFGLPTLESLASGTPTVLADASCSREVGGTAASYFPSGDIDAAEGAVEGSLQASEKDRVATEGPTRAREFSWDRVAHSTAEVYRSVLASTGVR